MFQQLMDIQKLMFCFCMKQASMFLKARIYQNLSQWQRYKTNGEKSPIPNPMQAEQIFYSAETIDDWCRMLLPYTQLSEEEKRLM